MRADTYVTFSESRLLPALMTVLIIALVSFISIARELSILTRACLMAPFALAVVWTTWRVFSPRWVLRVSDAKICYRKLGTKEVVEIKRLELSKAFVRWQSAPDPGGIGFRPELILVGNDNKWVLPLPLMDVKSSRIINAINASETK
jgi:hypothetical protein